MKLISKRFLPYALVGTMMLAGCGNNVENKEETLVEPTTTATTEEFTEEIPEVAETTKEATKDYYALAAESYNKYADFYAFTEMAYEDENGNVNIDRIENVIKVINGDVADLTSSEVSAAVKNIEWIVYPEYIGKKINFKRTNAYEYITDEKDLDVIKMVSMNAPKLSEYLTDEEAKAAGLESEALMDKIVAEMNESYDSVSEETIQETKAIMDKNEHLYREDINYINDDTTSMGNKIVLNIYKEKIIELYADMTGEYTYGEFKIAPYGEDEVNAISAYNTRPETMTDEEKIIYNNYEDHYLGKDYKNAICQLEQGLSKYAIDNANVHSQIEELKRYKDYLISQKTNEFEYTLSI